MVRLGSLIGLIFLLSGCLEQELDRLNSSEAVRLLSGDSGKDWTTSGGDYQLQLDQSSTQLFLLTDNAGDSVSYGTWTITEDVRENFTDSLLFDLTVVDASNPLSEITTVNLLTSELLDLQSDDQLLRFSYSKE